MRNPADHLKPSDSISQHGTDQNPDFGQEIMAHLMNSCPRWKAKIFTVSSPQVRRLFTGDHRTIGEIGFTVDIIPSYAVETFSTAKGILYNGSIPDLDAIFFRSLFPHLGDRPKDFMTHDDGIRSRGSGCLAPVHPYIRTAHADHVDFKKAFFRANLRKGKFF
jgi:hypothetical protein